MSDNEQPTAPFWMTTFSDMMTLLLVFFVLIVSMSEIKIKRFEEALTYFQGGRGVLNQQSVMNNTLQTHDTPNINRRQAEQFEELNAYLRENGLEDKVQVNLRPDGVQTVITTDSVMFDSGEAKIIEPAGTILRLLAGVIDADIQAVAVEGHTDSLPIQTRQYPTNWELSAARAATVVRFLQRHEDVLSPERYVALGYGEYRPVASNATPAGRAQNRRVEILFSWESWQNKMNPSLKNLPKERIRSQPMEAGS
jgi:chemotaxis protein MotB